MEKCTGCKLCVAACSLIKEKKYDLAKSRLWIVRNEDECLGIPTVCEQCERPPCLVACPTKAISKDSTTGVVLVDPSKCIGCKECMQACPFGAIMVDPHKGIAYKCDLCNGDPECVKVCNPGALQYVRMDDSLVPKRVASVERRVKAITALIKGGGG